jgi:hypothetical protein
MSYGRERNESAKLKGGNERTRCEKELTKELSAGT